MFFFLFIGVSARKNTVHSHTFTRRAYLVLPVIYVYRDTCECVSLGHVSTCYIIRVMCFATQWISVSLCGTRTGTVRMRVRERDERLGPDSARGRRRAPLHTTIREYIAQRTSMRISFYLTNVLLLIITCYN